MNISEIALRVDARGLSCPMPIVKTAQAIRTMQSGDLLELVATDPGSVKDVAAWCRTTANELVDERVTGGEDRFVIRRK